MPPAVKLKQEQRGGRVAAAVLWVRISSSIDYAVFIAVMLLNVSGCRLLRLRDRVSRSDGEDIYGSGGGKGCISSREDVVGGGSVT